MKDNPIATAAMRPGFQHVKPATAGEFILRLCTALLMVFAVTLALVHTEVYFSRPQRTGDFTNIMFF
jgi:hypothetical protein